MPAPVDGFRLSKLKLTPMQLSPLGIHPLHTATLTKNRTVIGAAASIYAMAIENANNILLAMPDQLTSAYTVYLGLDNALNSAAQENFATELAKTMDDISLKLSTNSSI